MAIFFKTWCKKMQQLHFSVSSRCCTCLNKRRTDLSHLLMGVFSQGFAREHVHINSRKQRIIIFGINFEGTKDISSDYMSPKLFTT